MAASEILEIVSPVLYRMCSYYISEQNGNELRYEEFSADITRLLNEARRQADKHESLKADFRKIEFPLIFFIDYTVKESGFSFSRDYVPMAHSYNELSGDDKFFDLFDEAVRVEKNPDILTIYYIMLGLGFDGAYRREPVEVIRRMQASAEMLEGRLKKGYDQICLTRKPSAASADKSWNTYRSFKILAVMVLVTLMCFVLNGLSIQASTASFRSSIRQAMRAASPSEDYLVGDTGNTIFRAGSESDAADTGSSFYNPNPDAREILKERDIPADDAQAPEDSPAPAGDAGKSFSENDAAAAKKEQK